MFSKKDNTLKWIALITMIIDHLGFYLFPSMLSLRIIGRLSLPLFIYLSAKGVSRTKSINKYLFRMGILGVISSFITGVFPLNVMFLLFGFCLTKKFPYLHPIVAILSVFFDYGIYGYFLAIFIDYLFVKENPNLKNIILLWLISSILMFLVVGWIQVFSLLSLAIIYLVREIDMPKMNRWVWYAFYPVHIQVLIWISRVI